ncbi:MAG: hypothetical protein ABJO29_05250 [Yoonia sp.]|uniref:hypothetical protein n=1 Tax=Yoonia sp. TaxID=2212373 RepID=UPI0032646C75
MLKPMLALLTLAATTACMDVDGADVSRNYTGSLNGCPGLTGISAQYSQSVAGMPVRCGPQSASPVTFR